MTDPIIHFSNVKKHYGMHQVLNGIELELQQGEFIGLVGINGAGKTTLMKCLLDFTSITSGAITIDGTAHGKPESRSDLAYLPEKFTPPYYLTGRDFLEYMARMYGVSSDANRTKQMLVTLDFNPEFLDKPVRQMSKGMSQKLGLAACFLGDKRLLVLDEPMSGLDPRARVYLIRCLEELRQQGKTLFFSTHLLTDVERVCDRVAILHGGEIKFSGTPHECCEKYGVSVFEDAYLSCVGSAI